MAPSASSSPSPRHGTGGVQDTRHADLALPGGRRLDLSEVRVMGILNATPDSFSDGGELADADSLHERIGAMLAAGADLLDVGGESTRPGHAPVPAQEEVRRILPVLAAIRRIDSEVPVSIDTRKAVVASTALAAGADIVNDVSALGDPAMGEVVRTHGCPVILMRNGDLVGDAVAACRAELAAAVARARAAGIPRGLILLDPGLGFGARPGPRPDDNLALVDRVTDYALGHPVVVGASRKRFVGALAGEEDPLRRVTGSVAVAVRAARAGAAVVRVHDVAQTVAGLRRDAATR